MKRKTIRQKIKITSNKMQKRKHKTQKWKSIIGTAKKVFDKTHSLSKMRESIRNQSYQNIRGMFGDK